MTNTWKEALADRMPSDLAREIDIFDTQIDLRKQDKLDEKMFAELRLRRGAYGQRYDNRQRHDGIRKQSIDFPCGDLTKGPETAFDAPGMIRIKIPFGGVTPEQMEVMADISEEYSVGVIHVTTRQDYQMHYIHIGDTPDLMRRLAAVGITTREACGNSVRNVTACPFAGICTDETFDVTPYADICTKFLLGHADVQDFGRKFKIAFSGCRQHACGLVSMHDMGAIAVERDGKRGFELYVGGGLGAVPQQAKLFDEFVPEEELLKVAQAIARVFARLGEKKTRARARIKFLVKKLGIDEFKRLVQEEMKIMPHDPRWTGMLDEVKRYSETPAKSAEPLNGVERPEGFDAWYATNVYKQRQEGYLAVTVSLPLGDLTAWQMRKLADLARTYCGDNVRITVEQNTLLRWVSESDVINLYSGLVAIGLGDPGAGTLVDITACPGTDSCKLGISSSRGLAGELVRRIQEKNATLDEAIRNLRIKVSGCFNSCGQHHISDIGFYGVNRMIGGYAVPHFQLILGGKWKENGGAYGLAIGAIPSKSAPEVVDRITTRFASERQSGESFQDFITRIGKRELKEMFADLTKVPDHDTDASFYSDWGDPREYTHGDRGKGECAGEMVDLVQFNLADAEREVFEAQILMDENKPEETDAMAYRALLSAARALVKTQYLDIPDDPDTIVEEFRKRFYDTELFFDPYAKGKFANYLFRRHARENGEISLESVRQLIEETQLFIEASHNCERKMHETIQEVAP